MSAHASCELVTVVGACENPEFSICTLVTRNDEYKEMQESFHALGFDSTCSEYLMINNEVRNIADAYVGVNALLLAACAPYIILCHQDVLLLADGRERILELIKEVEELDPHWGLLGNAGSTERHRIVTRISDPHGADRRLGKLPAKVSAVDENFILVRREANLAVSRDLGGYHHYGHDLSIVADMLGWSCYVIDFHLCHKSAGVVDKTFIKSRRDMMAKYKRAFRGRVIAGTTHKPYVIGSSSLWRVPVWLMILFVRQSNRVLWRIGWRKPWRDAL